MNTNIEPTEVCIALGDLHLLDPQHGNCFHAAFLAATQQEHRADLMIEMQFTSAGSSSIQLLQVDGEEIY